MCNENLRSDSGPDLIIESFILHTLYTICYLALRFTKSSCLFSIEMLNFLQKKSFYGIFLYLY